MDVIQQAMPKLSAGLVMYRWRAGELEVLLVHPGGPYWAQKDKGAWTIPKGEPTEGEALLAAARREFEEETGFVPRGPFHAVGTIKQAGGKQVSAWAFEGDCDPTELRSNAFEMEWPPRSKRLVQFAEVDRGAWFPLPQAFAYILISQRSLLEALCERLRGEVAADVPEP